MPDLSTRLPAHARRLYCTHGATLTWGQALLQALQDTDPALATTVRGSHTDPTLSDAHQAAFYSHLQVLDGLRDPH